MRAWFYGAYYMAQPRGDTAMKTLNRSARWTARLAMTVGGMMLVVGTLGLLYLKRQSDRDPASASMFSMDVAFLILLFLASFTGLLLLALRETTALGTLLVIHLGIVAGLFITMPYGKFAHVVYRYAALVRYAIEQRRAI